MKKAKKFLIYKIISIFLTICLVSFLAYSCFWFIIQKKDKIVITNLLKTNQITYTNLYAKSVFNGRKYQIENIEINKENQSFKIDDALLSFNIGFFDFSQATISEIKEIKLNINKISDPIIISYPICSTIQLFTKNKEIEKILYQDKGLSIILPVNRKEIAVSTQPTTLEINTQSNHTEIQILTDLNEDMTNCPSCEKIEMLGKILINGIIKWQKESSELQLKGQLKTSIFAIETDIEINHTNAKGTLKITNHHDLLNFITILSLANSKNITTSNISTNYQIMYNMLQKLSHGNKKELTIHITQDQNQNILLNNISLNHLLNLK